MCINVSRPNFLISQFRSFLILIPTCLLQIMDIPRLMGGLSFTSTSSSDSTTNEDQSSLMKAVDVKDLLSSLSSSSSSSTSDINGINLNTDSPTTPSSPTVSMLKGRDGIRYQLLQTRQQQMVRDLVACEERLAALKSKRNNLH